MKKKIKIMVLMGGPSAEHRVSLNTGRQIMANLNAKTYDVLPVTISKSGRWQLPAASSKPLTLNAGSRLLVLRDEVQVRHTLKNAADVVFIALHGKYGEDGTVQGLLESARVAYTGSGVLASALGMDKPRSLSIFRDNGLYVPDFTVLSRRDIKRMNVKKRAGIVGDFGLPLVVKPSDHGSSIGVTIVHKLSQLAPAMHQAFRYSPDIMIQRFIKGRELTCGVLEKKSGKLMPLPPVEIVPKAGNFYDYESKYTDGGSDHLIPPPGFSASMIATIQDAACVAHRSLGCKGMSRTDFILSGDGKFYVLEINTIPGMTETSLLPQAAAVAGVSFSKLLTLLVNNALSKNKNKR